MMVNLRGFRYGESLEGRGDLEAIVEFTLAVKKDQETVKSPFRMRYGDTFQLIASPVAPAVAQPGAPAVAQPGAPTPNEHPGNWYKDGHRLADCTATALSVTMSRAATEAGRYTFTTDEDADRPDHTIDLDVSLPWRRLFDRPTILFFIVIVFLYVLSAEWMFSRKLLWFTFTRLPDDGGARTVRSYVFAVVTLGFFFALVQLAGKMSSTGQGGWTALFVGSDMRASTSKFQYLMWTFVLGFVLAYIAARSHMEPKPFECVTGDVPTNCVPRDLWSSYLLLLGFPAGAAAAAKGLISAKVQNGTVQKSDSQSTPAVADLGTNDDGDPDLVDIQYLLFNMIAMAYVVAVFIGRGTLPAVPDLLLGLTGAAAGTYVLNKSLQNNAPVITSVIPSLVISGQPVTVSGRNFFPEGTSSATVKVNVGGRDTTGTCVRDRQSDTVNLIAPPGMNPKDPNLRIITPAQVETDGFPITLTGIEVIGWEEAALPPRGSGASVKLGVLGLPFTGNVDLPVKVKVGGLVVSAEGVGQDVISFTLPVLTTGDVEIVVLWNGQASDPVKLSLGP
jgi:IPT/TIG domain